MNSSTDRQEALLRARIVYLEAKLNFFRRYAEALIALAYNADDKLAGSISRGNVAEEVERLRRRNAELERKVDILYNSVSWRITRPIRNGVIPRLYDQLFQRKKDGG